MQAPSTKRNAEMDVADLQDAGKRQRAVVHTEKLAILVASYHTHYGDYCRGRKNVTQRIPAKVWKAVYIDFLQSCKDSISAIDPDLPFDESVLPAERTLQDALRACLDQDTGVADEKNAEKVTVQDEDILRRLKKTDGHARRNMIMWRSKLISNPSSLSTGSKRTTSQEASTIDINGDDSQNAEPILDRIESKKSMQRRAADAIEKIAKSMDESGIATVSLMKEQLSVTKEAEFRKKEILQHQLEIGAL
jgi:hypothetical protein